MKMLRNIGFAVAALSALAFTAAPAMASSVLLCGPLNNSAGSKRVVNPNTSTGYTLNSNGCAMIAYADVSWFLSQGYAIRAPFGSVVTSGIANNFTAVLPAGAYIRDIIFQEISGAAITGGMMVGSASSTSDVVSTAVTVGSKGYGFATDVGLAKRVFSATAPQTLYFGAFAAGGTMNQGDVIATVVYGLF